MLKYVKTSLLVLCLCTVLPLSSMAREQIVFDLYLNTEFKGQYFGFITDDQDFLLAKDDLASLGLGNLGRVEWIDKVEYVHVRTLAPQITSEFNEKNIALYLMASPDLLDTTSINFRRSPPKGTINVSDNSAFLNYSLNYSADDNYDFINFSLPVEAGVRWQDLLYYSNAIYSDDGEDTEFVRLFSNVVKDEPEIMRRSVFGDFNAATGELGGGATLGGIKISRNFSLSPYFLQSPGLDLQGQLQTPSDVELWRNGTLLESQKFSPGSFEFLNIPLTSGAGEAELLIRDAFGQEQRVTYPFYFSSTLLKKGLHEYDYNLGVMRREFGQESFSYAKVATLFSHRYGFNDALTGGVRGEFAEDVLSGGLSVGFVVEPVGVFSLAAAASDFRGRFGSAASAGYSYSGRGILSGHLTYRLRSRDYSNLSLDPSDDRARSELLCSLSLNLRPFGSLSAFFTSSDRYEDEDVDRLTLRYTKNLTRKLGFEIAASTTRGDETEEELFVTLRYHFDQGPSIYASHGKNDTETRSSVTVQKSPSANVGFGYRLQADKTEPDQGENTDRYDGELTYRTRYGDYNARVTSTNNLESYNLRATGSLSMVNGSFHFGQYINDSFAVIKVGDLEGVEISRSNSPIGRTDSNGEILSAGMISYYANKISLNEQDIPMNYKYRQDEKHISLPYRGGAFIELDVDKFQSAIGRFFVKDVEAAKPAEYWRLDLQLDGEVAEFPVGSGGDFYLEDLPVGNYRATLVKGATNCNLTLTIPESEDIFVDLGDVYCELD